MPLLYAMWNGDEHQTNIIRNAIAGGGLENMKAIQTAIKETGAIEYTEAIANKEAENAIQSLEGLPDSPYLEALHALAHFSVARDY